MYFRALLMGPFAHAVQMVQLGAQCDCYSMTINSFTLGKAEHNTH